MKEFSLVLIFVVTFTCAIEMNYDYKPGMWRHLARGTHHLERRQMSPNCSRAYREYESPRFQACLAVLEKFDEEDITNDDLGSYCMNRCNSEIIRVSTDLAICSGGGSPPDEHEKDVLRFLCTKNINDDYCDIAFENYEKDKTAPDFDKCDPSVFPCTADCKAVVHYINTKLGCCFASAVEYGFIRFNDTIGFFEKCGAEYIPAC